MAKDNSWFDNLKPSFSEAVGISKEELKMLDEIDEVILKTKGKQSHKK